jgi:dethiobiotin synthetase
VPRGLFVTGTDTGVGKTVVASAIIAALAAEGRVAGFKPVVTGLDEPPGAAPQDHVLLGACAGMDPDAVAPWRFGPAVSPHLAAALAGVEIDPGALERAAAGAGEPLIVEGVGGFLVPLFGDYLIRDLAVALAMPVVVVARPGLGTISHTLLTLEAVRAAGLEVAAVVLTPWPASPSAMERSNRATIAALGRVEVAALAPLADFSPSTLAGGGASLPIERWMDDDASVGIARVE